MRISDLNLLVGVLIIVLLIIVMLAISVILYRLLTRRFSTALGEVERRLENQEKIQKENHESIRESLLETTRINASNHNHISESLKDMKNQLSVLEVFIEKIQSQPKPNNSPNEPKLPGQSLYAETVPNVEEQYNKAMLNPEEEDEFIKGYNCDSIAILNYQERNVDAHDSNAAFEKDIQGKFLLVHDKLNNYFAVPKFNATIKSRYYKMFESIFVIETNRENNNRYELVKAAELRSVANNRYELVNKGMIQFS